MPHTPADVTDRDSLQRAMNGADVVVHMAALLHIPRPPQSMVAEYRRINVDGAIAAFHAARDSGVKRFVFTSSIAVYGRGHAGLIDEDTPADPDTPYARTKRDAEVALRQLATGQRPEVVVLRLAAVYGPGIKGNYDRLVRAIARRRFVAVGRGSNRRTLVYEDDAAHAIVLGTAHPEATGHIFNVTGGTHTVAEIAAAIGAAVGRRPPRLTIPLWIARVGVVSIETLAALIGREGPVTRAMLEKYTEDVRVSGARIHELLGFEPSVGLEEGWRRTVHGMRERGLLT